MEEKKTITDAEAALLDRGRMQRKFIPKDEKTQIVVCALVERGLMHLGSQVHNDNRCWTSFKGGMALASWASARGDDAQGKGK
jgi:hypothetical protein